MSGFRCTGAALLLGALALPGSLGAQDVRLADAPRSEAQEALEAFLAAGDYTLWTRDTVLARGDTVPGNLLVLEGSARIAGRVEGDIYVVDGDLFLRSQASIAGDVVVLGGGFYDSDLATVEGSITYRPNERIRVRPTQGDFEVISEVEPRPAFEPDGTWGVHIPVYDRVDALTLAIGGLARANAAPGRPELELVSRYKTGPEKLDASGRISIYPSDRVRIGVAGGRETRTNDRWIRPRWYNSFAHFVAGDDAFDYYRADFARVELELASPEPPIWEDAPTWRLIATGGWEEARSLSARDVTVLFGDDAPDEAPFVPYPNPAVTGGDLFTGTLGFDWTHRGREGRIGFGLGLEAGIDDTFDGDFSFLMAEGRFSARRPTSWGHAWDVFAIGRVDLAGTPPGQRYSTIGGNGTIPTVALRGLRGHRLAYAEATYAVPLLGMATLGGLDVFARATAGTAWSEGEPFVLQEALSGGVAIRLWDFQMESGVAVGSDPLEDGVDTVVFFDIRVRRGTRPGSMPRSGRGFD